MCKELVTPFRTVSSTSSFPFYLVRTMAGSVTTANTKPDDDDDMVSSISQTNDDTDPRLALLAVPFTVPHPLTHTTLQPPHHSHPSSHAGSNAHRTRKTPHRASHLPSDTSPTLPSLTPPCHPSPLRRKQNRTAPDPVSSHSDDIPSRQRLTSGRARPTA